MGAIVTPGPDGNRLSARVLRMSCGLRMLAGATGIPRPPVLATALRLATARAATARAAAARAAALRLLLALLVGGVAGRTLAAVGLLGVGAALVLVHEVGVPGGGGGEPARGERG